MLSEPQTPILFSINSEMKSKINENSNPRVLKTRNKELTNYNN